MKGKEFIEFIKDNNLEDTNIGFYVYDFEYSNGTIEDSQDLGRAEILGVDGSYIDLAINYR